MESLFQYAATQHEDVSTGETPFLLESLEVFNWGPFAGMHRAEIDPRGTAVIGPTGSGKTTLIDGLMTLLVAQPRYNLASTGGHESDRTLIDYVRGVLGGDGSGGKEETSRPGKTITGICASYGNGNQRLRLGVVLWTDGPSNALPDLKRRWVFSQAENESLSGWLRMVHEQGLREFTKHGKNTEGLRIFDSKKAYLSHTRKFFDVSENAFTLLNRAAGLKQLNSIDEIFRELVLDDHSAFDRALQVAGEFDNLSDIHAELETARRQKESLTPIATDTERLEKLRAQEAEWLTLKRILPIWFATVGERLWSEQTTALSQKQEEAAARLRTQEQLETECETREETLRERYLKLGGNAIGELEKRIDDQKALVSERQKHADNYQRVMRDFGLSDELSEESLIKNQGVLKTKQSEFREDRKKKQDETLEVYSQHREAERESQRLEEELRKVKERPGSNIPPKFQDFRALLADQLGLDDTDLPFVAELVEVKAEESPWRGAIERAIGPDRLRVLVPEAQMDQALRWVNDRDNRLHVRLQRARGEVRPYDFFPDGFTQKLGWKAHPLAETAKELLASRDRHCVDTPEALKSVDHGMTVQGLMSDRGGRFEKQDQRRLDEGWLTGFDNKDQLQSLSNQFRESHTQTRQLAEARQKLQRELDQYDGQLRLIEGLLELEFSKINLPSLESELAANQDRLNNLLDPNSDASKAKAEFETEREKHKTIRSRIDEIKQRIAVIKSKLDLAQGQRDEASQRKGPGLEKPELELAEKKLAIAPETAPEKLEAREREARQQTDLKLEAKQEQLRALEQRLIRLMEAAQRVDTGALAETGTELDDLPDYLGRLQVLEQEALPEKLNRFLEYLNRSSDQGVTQLLASITEEVDTIEQRIEDLNRTLTKVDFRSNRYLQLKPNRTQHERIRSMDGALRHLRSATYKSGEDEGEAQFKALRNVIEILRDAGENRRQLGSRALLDPRYRLQFFVVEVNRSNGEASAPRTGSQSGSGGEKELMASHILTASLSYALCPAGATSPLYGTIVLDEAFSKSSPSAASRIIEALRIFGLHPIFVTPNKEIGLLKRHTNRVICVQRPRKEASLASISWERLEELSRQT